MRTGVPLYQNPKANHPHLAVSRAWVARARCLTGCCLCCHCGPAPCSDRPACCAEAVAAHGAAAAACCLQAGSPGELPGWDSCCHARARGSVAAHPTDHAGASAPVAAAAAAAAAGAGTVAVGDRHQGQHQATKVPAQQQPCAVLGVQEAAAAEARCYLGICCCAACQLLTAGVAAELSPLVKKDGLPKYVPAACQEEEAQPGAAAETLNCCWLLADCSTWGAQPEVGPARFERQSFAEFPCCCWLPAAFHHATARRWKGNLLLACCLLGPHGPLACLYQQSRRCRYA